jgi:hypothetical protein
LVYHICLTNAPKCCYCNLHWWNSVASKLLPVPCLR